MKRLNPLLFSGKRLSSEVRESLLKIAEVFLSQLVEDSQLDLPLVDILLVGSNASYNYTDHSDIDLHLVLNFNQVVAYPKEVLKAYCYAEKTNFNQQYDFTIHDIPVEVYVEDLITSSNSNGIYSVMRDKWIKFPTEDSFEDHIYDKELYDVYRQEILLALSSNKMSQVDEMINRLYLLRKDSLASEGEHGQGNLIFKELRNQGLLDRLKDKRDKMISKELSVEQLHLPS